MKKHKKLLARLGEEVMNMWLIEADMFERVSSFGSEYLSTKELEELYEARIAVERAKINVLLYEHEETVKGAARDAAAREIAAKDAAAREASIRAS